MAGRVAGIMVGGLGMRQVSLGSDVTPEGIPALPDCPLVLISSTTGSCFDLYPKPRGL